MAIDLQQRWQQLWERLGLSGADEAFVKLSKAYAEPKRQYHRIAHIDACLRQFDTVMAADLRDDLLELAIWFHDVVFDPTRHDNEERSADEAIAMLAAAGMKRSQVDRVASLILATHHSTMPRDAGRQLIADIDLSILGRSRDMYHWYARAIRLEYSHVSDIAYATGRKAFLRAMLARPTIYNTFTFQDRYELPARANMEREIEELNE